MDHISVCICTFHRPELLLRLLERLTLLRSDPRFTFSAVVVDNDRDGSARQVTETFAARSPFAVVYAIEPVASFALVRNRTVALATGEFIAFIDDDEVPVEGWLVHLYNASLDHKADGVLGPVLPEFDAAAPDWVRRGGFYDRPRHETGFQLGWSECRTGNVLFRRQITAGVEGPFRAEFSQGGEDQDFFRRMIEKGHRFIWCDEAEAYETVPPHRCTLKFLVDRALLRGRISVGHSRGRMRNIAKALLAVPAYAVALPFLYVSRKHLCMKYYVRMFDHLGRLLTLAGVNPVKERTH